VIRLVALTPDHLEPFRQLMGSDAFGGCFCAVWSAFGADWGARCADPAQPNFDETRERVLRGEHTGYLVYEDSVLVAWTGSGPTTGFALLKQKLGSRLSPAGPRAWSIGCVAVRPQCRGRGLSQAVVLAVLDQARAKGASFVDAYPTDPWDEPRSYRGSRSMYLRLGFVEQARESDGDSEILWMRHEVVPQAVGQRPEARVG
jgi:GNAT superfamily N-acetyltransferase